MPVSGEMPTSCPSRVRVNTVRPSPPTVVRVQGAISRVQAARAEKPAGAACKVMPDPATSVALTDVLGLVLPAGLDFAGRDEALVTSETSSLS